MPKSPKAHTIHVERLKRTLAVAGATPNRAAAARQLAPASTAARTRRRKSIDKG